MAVARASSRCRTRVMTPWGVSSLSFQVEPAFEGTIDRLDQLAEWLQEPRAGAGSLPFPCRTDELCASGGEEALELGADVTLVGHDDLARLLTVTPITEIPQSRSS